MRNKVLRILTIMIIMLMMIASFNKVFAGNVSFSTSGGKFGTGGTQDLTVTVKFPDGVQNAQATVMVTFADGNTPSPKKVLINKMTGRNCICFIYTNSCWKRNGKSI